MLALGFVYTGTRHQLHGVRRLHQRSTAFNGQSFAAGLVLHSPPGVQRSNDLTASTECTVPVVHAKTPPSTNRSPINTADTVAAFTHGPCVPRTGFNLARISTNQSSPSSTSSAADKYLQSDLSNRYASTDVCNTVHYPHFIQKLDREMKAKSCLRESRCLQHDT